MASGRNHQLYGQVSEETNTTSKLVPSGRGISEFSGPREVRGECLELSENNFQLASISDDSTFPAIDGDTTSLPRSADQQISVPGVFQLTLLPGRGITEIPTNVEVIEVQQQRHFTGTLPSTFNDNGLFGTNSRANIHSPTQEGFNPPISGQAFVRQRFCVSSSASHSQPTIPPGIPLETNYATPRHGTPSANIYTPLALYDMQTFRPSLPSNNRSPPQGTMSTYAEEGLISIQRGNNTPYSSTTGNNISDMGINRQLAEGHQMITATSECGHEYKLNREEVIKPEFARYEARLATFAEWPHSTDLAPEAVANAGFYLVNQDYTKCFACDGGLDSWQPDDVPIKEHAKFYKDCPYVREVAMGKLLETKGEDCASGEERSLTNVKLTTGRAGLSHLGAMGTNPNRCPLLPRATDPPLPADSSTASGSSLRTIYMQLVGMGFAQDSVEKSMRNIMYKRSKEKSQKELTLVEVLDDLTTKRDVETSEDDPQISSNCINECAVS